MPHPAPSSGSIVGITSLPQAWQEALRDRAEQPFLNIASAEEAQFLRYRARSFFRRAGRVAIGLTELLGKNEGAHIGILVDDDHDFSLILHGIWSAGFTAVPISQSFSDDVITGLLNNSGTRVVLFSFAAAARVAGLFGRLATVEHWIVTGGGGRAPMGAGIKRLDDLTADAGNDPFDLEQGRTASADGERAALLVLSSGLGDGTPHGIEFNHRQLLQAASNACAAIELGNIENQKTQDEEAPPISIGSLLPKRGLASLLFTQLVPLIGGGVGTLGIEYETKDFWEQMQLNGIQCAILDQHQLRSVVARGKPRNFSLNQGMRTILIPSGVVSSRWINGFTQQFNSPLIDTYFHSEVGGVVTAARYDQKSVPGSTSTEIPWLASAGICMPGVDVMVVDQAGNELQVGLEGEIVVRSTAAMTRYAATRVGDTFVDSSQFHHTGDTGILIESGNKKNREFAVTGRASDKFVRGDQVVNLALVNAAASEIRGIQSVRVVAFDNDAVGSEIGIFIVANRALGLTEDGVISSLAAVLPPSHVPRVVLFGMTMPSLQVTLERFRPFSKSRF